jgi:porphobilinogen synthase
MSFPENRLRRLRANPAIRNMVRETQLTVSDLIYPMFVREGAGVRNEIKSMPGQYQVSIDTLVEDCVAIEQTGIPAVILFGIPDDKDAVGNDSFNDNGIIQRAIRAVKEKCKTLQVITDVCFCEYTDHGHCGVLHDTRDGGRTVDNDATLANTAKQVVSHARAGADMVAPSGMMDGVVGTIRDALDEAGFEDLPIMAYAAKFSSAYYGPFRDAAESPPQFGDRKDYQMDPANAEEALREAALDIEEGADIVMVKPAVNYLDIIRRVKDTFAMPTAAYHVSGEFAMIKAAAANGWIDEKACALETTLAIKRAGADLVLTYYAKDLAEWLR